MTEIEFLQAQSQVARERMHASMRLATQSLREGVYSRRWLRLCIFPLGAAMAIVGMFAGLAHGRRSDRFRGRAEKAWSLPARSRPRRSWRVLSLIGRVGGGFAMQVLAETVHWVLHPPRMHAGPEPQQPPQGPSRGSFHAP